MQKPKEKIFIELEKWVGKYNCINPIRLVSTYYLASQLIDKSNKKIFAIFVKITLWIFAIDDLFDNPTHKNDLSSIKSHICNYSINNISTELSELVDELDLIFKEIIDNFDNSEYINEIIKLRNKMVEAMYSESIITDVNCLNLNDYLEKGKHSIGAPLVLIVVLYFIDTKINKINDDILNLIESVGEIIRLLNDLVSFDKEIAEHKQNSLSILGALQPDRNANIKRVKTIIINKIDLLKLQEEKYTTNNLHVSFKFCISMCEIVREFYLYNDFHKYNNLNI